MKGISGQCCGSGREAHADVVVLFYFLMRQKHRWDLLLIHTHSGADKRVIKKKPNIPAHTQWRMTSEPLRLQHF